jgi:hypothetical protein
VDVRRGRWRAEEVAAVDGLGVIFLIILALWLIGAI